ncbi:signal protein PDZ [Alteromonas sp. H39]|uniref:signal protein PDZ n=1 Tax=Alteromonas sp. H39 TaxID=3389876 RepID=UPI0039E11CAD
MIIARIRTCLVLFCLAVSSHANAGATDWMPFTVDDGHILVDITMAGHPVKAILDTGAEHNGVSHAFIEHYKPDFVRAGRTRIKGPFGEDIRDRYNAVDVKIFGVDLELDKLVDLDFGSPDHALLLGAGFFDDFITQVDYPNQRIRLIDRDSINIAEYRNVRVEQDAKSYMLLVNVTLNKQEDVWLILDTGLNGGIMVERRIARNNNWLDGNFKTVTTDSVGVARDQDIESFLLPSVILGPYEVENVIVSTPIEGQDLHINTDVGAKEQTGTRIRGNQVSGLLGYDVLKHFVLTIDYERGYLHIGLPEDI